MQGDQELLTLAAKGAGIEHEGEAGSWLAGIGNPALLLAGTETVWNPLRNDADALRLAVKLHLRLLWLTNINGRFVSSDRDGIMFCPEPLDGQDENAATRRAIVCAAAAIGEKMP
jgi:hypothetical protein